MKSAFLVFVVVFLTAGSLTAQTSQTFEAKEAEYTRTINSRAQKIVSALAISDSPKLHRVQTIIVNQYRNLNNLHTRRDDAVKMLKGSDLENSEKDAQVKKVRSGIDSAISILHNNYLLQLGKELSEEEVNKVKDGMTYNVVNITYNGYLDMLPKLTAEQKTQIMVWLLEAREHAMDAETSDKKHAWFGKYKGRINNYLSAAGYDLKKEGEAWQQRIKERTEKKNTPSN